MERLIRKPIPDEISRDQFFDECLKLYQKYRIESDQARGQLSKLEESMFYFLNLMREAHGEENAGRIVRFTKDEEGRLSFTVERK